MSTFSTPPTVSIVLSMRFFNPRYLLISLLVFSAVPAFSQTIARVDVTAASTVVVVGQTMPVLAAAKDADGVVIPVASFTWTSGTPSVATVDSSGNVTALFPGRSEEHTSELQS